MYRATGRRKSSVARVRLMPGAGKKTVNGVDLDKYFCRISLSRTATEPLLVANLSDKYDLIASVRGPMGKEGFLTRDSRMTERKTYGQAGARKRFQFSKR